MDFSVYIPARYGASRLPGKPLLEIAGKPIIQYVFENALNSGAKAVVIATDDPRIERACAHFGAQVVMTKHSHTSGTDRIAEAVVLNQEAGDRIIVNVQADEPLLPPEVIAQVAGIFAQYPETDISTVCETLSDDKQLEDPNIVKVARTIDNCALYFSRAPIPFAREVSELELARKLWRRHVGIYAYRAEYLQQFVALKPSDLERVERLEQLRAMSHGHRIRVVDALADCGIGVDTKDDYVRVKTRMRS